MTPMQVRGALTRVRVVGVAAAKHHTLAVTDSGDVYSWGSNKDGRLGVGGADSQFTPKRVTALSKRVVAVAAGNRHSVGRTGWLGTGMGADSRAKRYCVCVLQVLGLNHCPSGWRGRRVGVGVDKRGGGEG